ncbi:sensor histidine kinase [Roseicella aerolata]|uniref:histidine kinase n=1 Tax=Roseicella aerolata TaxID=2883479 RepID=A0A9X1L9C9_9PROT|nr:HAMP domain-containing sensor histidine kinase [Roseicella aerolata]MCB4821050.1 HAMP domain-containing histidine kinase [Roseicella aerolata]
MRRDRPRWWRTTAFRITLLHLGLTLLGTLALSGVAWWATTGFALRQLAQDVEQDSGLLVQAARLGGPGSVVLSIEARIAADRSGTQYYLLAGPDGRRLAGNLAAAPRAAGWRRLRLSGAEVETELLALGTPLPGGTFLVVGRAVAPVRQLEGFLLAAAGWVGGAALLLGLLGGVVVGRGVTRRAAAMDAVLARVEAGEIGHRLLLREGNDEFDRLARRINTVLDRVQGLMQALRQVTDDIAHDLRTPLNRLRQRLDAALRTAEGDAAWREATEGAIAECEQLLDIFAALLRIAQVESGARRAGFAPFNLSEVVETVAEVHAPPAEARGQRLETRIEPGIVAVGDRDLVTQMLSNLVDNAVKHGRAGGRILLSLATRPEGGMVLAVSDDGPGVPAEARPLVLRRFHRLDAARATPGTGLGLALVAAVAELHGMALTLGDNGPGLVVRLDIPAVSGNAAAAGSAGDGPGPEHS